MTPSARLTLFEGVLLSLDAGSGAASRAVATARQLLEGAERPVIALQAPRASSREITEVREKVRAEIDKLRGSGDEEASLALREADTSADNPENCRLPHEKMARRGKRICPNCKKPLKLEEAFDRAKHPRARGGRFAKTISKLHAEHPAGAKKFSGQLDFSKLRPGTTFEDAMQPGTVFRYDGAEDGIDMVTVAEGPKSNEGNPFFEQDGGPGSQYTAPTTVGGWVKKPDTLHEAFDATRHPRGRGGEFAAGLLKMKPGETMDIAGTTVRRAAHHWHYTVNGYKTQTSAKSPKFVERNAAALADTLVRAKDVRDASAMQGKLYGIARGDIDHTKLSDEERSGLTSYLSDYLPKVSDLAKSGQFPTAYVGHLKDAQAKLAGQKTPTEKRNETRRASYAKKNAAKLREAKDSMAKASSPEPFSTSKTSNWVARSGGLPAYIQHIAHDLMEKRGKSESNAIQMAIGIVRNWASGKGNVDKNTRAAAAKAVAEFAKLRAKNAAKKAAKKLSEADLIEAELFERWDRYELTEAEVAEAAELEETWSEAARAAALRARHGMGGPGRELGHLQDRADTEMTPAKPGERLPMPDGSSLELVGHLRNNKKLVKFHDGSFGAVNDWRNDPKWHATHPDWKPGAVAEAKVEEPTKDPKEKPKDAKGGDSGAPGQNVDPGGERVANLQRRLSSLGFDAKDDGHFGPKTAAAVKSFQRHSALVEDGIVGAKTIEALRRAPHPQDMEDADKDRLLKAGEPDDDGDETQDAEAPDGKKIPGAASERGKTTPAPKSAAKPASGRAGTGSAVHLYKGTGVGEKKGDEKVRSVQADLGHLGYEVHTDGRFGPETEKTVKRFQRKYGLKPDGIVGPKTHRAMAGVTKKKKRLMECVEARKAATGSDAARLLARERMLRVQVEEGYDAGQLEEMWSAASRAAALMARRRTKGVGDMHPDWMERRDGEFPGEGLAREGERAHGMTEIGQRAFGTVRGGHLVTDSGMRVRTVGSPEKVTDAAGHEVLRRKQARMPIGHAQAVPRGV